MKRIDYLEGRVPEPKEEPLKKELASFSKLKMTGNPNWIAIDPSRPDTSRNDMGGVQFQRPWGPLETTSNTITDPTDPRSLLGATIYGGRITDVETNVGVGPGTNATYFTTHFPDGMYIRTVLDNRTIERSGTSLMELLTIEVRRQRQSAWINNEPLPHRPPAAITQEEAREFGRQIEIAERKKKMGIFWKMISWIRRDK